MMINFFKPLKWAVYGLQVLFAIVFFVALYSFYQWGEPTDLMGAALFLFASHHFYRAGISLRVDQVKAIIEADSEVYRNSSRRARRRFDRYLRQMKNRSNNKKI